MDLRKKILKKRDQLSKYEINRLSSGIKDNLSTIDSYLKAKYPLFFYSIKSEVNTLPIIEERLKAKKHVCLPRTIISKRSLVCYLISSLNDLIPGAYNIMEPDPAKCTEFPPEDLDIVIVPGSVFDKRGARFGYGGGFYDRFLSKEASQATRIALAFSFQVMDYDIPVRPHDEFMDYIVTEKGVIECNGRKKEF